MQRFGFVWFALAAVWALHCAGCGKSEDLPATAPVKGTVTYQGAPLPNAYVTFYPDSGDKPAAGTTDGSGGYSLTTFQKHDGAVPGEHTVTVTCYDSSFDGASMSSLIPDKYGSPLTSPLKITVGNEKNEIRLDLAD